VRFGPYLGKQYLLGDWHLNLVSTWRKGTWFTYNPYLVPGISYNVRWKDRYTFDVKISKTFQLGKARIKFYADIYNVFNLKTFASGYPYGGSRYGFTDSFDWNDYMQSLHLPAKIGDKLGYHNFAGSDQPGDYRKSGVEFVPMEWASDVTNLNNPSERPIYYDAATDSYQQWDSETGWHLVDPDFYDQVIR